ncbi:peptidyl-prolyl cis-trans isomerase D [[Candida] anglica]
MNLQYYWLLFLVSIISAASVSKEFSKITESELSNLKGDPSITEKAIFEISEKINDEAKKVGTLTIGLFGTVVPLTVKNFVELSKMTHGFGYKDCIFHRIISNFMVQGGDFQHSKGTGGYSIYNDFGRFDDENFELSHSKLGRLSMANAGPNTNGGQFFITVKDDCTWLDGKHVVFGQVIDGFSVLKYMEEVPTQAGDKPVNTLYISDIKVYEVEASEQNSDTESKISSSEANPEFEIPVVNDDKVPETSNSSFYRNLIIFCALIFVGIYVRDAYKKGILPSLSG